MVLNDLHLLWASVGPHEADPPLVIDSDAVLAGSITLQSFQPVPWWETKIVNRFCSPHLTKLAQRHREDPRIDRRYALTTPQTFGRLAPERSDHINRI